MFVCEVRSIDTHTHTHTHIYIYIYLYQSISINMMTCLCVKLEISIHTHTHTHIYIYIFISIYIDKYDDMFVCEFRNIDTYIYIYISVHIDKYDDIMFVYEIRTPLPTNMGVVLIQKPPASHSFTYSRTTFIRINWDGETSGCAENPDN